MVGLAAADGARLVRLGPLGPDEAVQMLADRMGHDRIEREPDAIAAFARLSGGLPLALAIVAARAATNPNLPLQGLSAQLDQPAGLRASSEQDLRRTPVTGRLDVLETGDEATSLRAGQPALVERDRVVQVAAHDLLRDYAASLARASIPEDHINAAIERSLDHYLQTAAAVVAIDHAEIFPASAGGASAGLRCAS